jgi:ABC-type transporter MlaC component
MENRRQGQAVALRAAWVTALVVGLGALGVRAATDKPKQVIQEAMDEVVAVLKNESVSKEQRREKIESIAYARFDFDYMAQLVLAKNLKQLSAQQRE